MPNEIKDFLVRNERALVANYRDYVDSMEADGQYETMESFSDWVAEEYKVMQEYQTQGYTLYEYA